MTSAEDYPDHVDDAEQLLRAVLTRHHIERIPLPDGTLRLKISRDFFLPFKSDEIGLSAFRELAGKDTIRKHADSMFSYCGFGRTQCADMREIDAEVEAAPIPKAPEHANIDLSTVEDNRSRTRFVGRRETWNTGTMNRPAPRGQAPSRRGRTGRRSAALARCGRFGIESRKDLT